MPAPWASRGDRVKSLGKADFGHETAAGGHG